VNGQPVQVLIVDDDYYAREALAALVARDPRTRVWAEVQSIAEALAQLASPGGRRAGTGGDRIGALRAGAVA